MKAKPKVGISACLLGENVRYDGGNKSNRYLTEELGKYVEWVPVCPETECGMLVPREPIELVGQTDFPKLLGVQSRTDHTEKMRRWIEEKLIALEKENLTGYIFKSKSPSCGIREVPVHTKDGVPFAQSAGMFAKAFMEKFPSIPVTDEELQNDSTQREKFINKLK